nr:PAS domain S-box protein [Methanosarcina horonobensis]
MQESEKKYRNIIETASEGIWISDSEFRTTYINKRMAEMAGYTQDEMIGRYAWDFTDEENKAIIKQNLEKRRQGVDESYESKFLRKDGSPLCTIVSSKSLFDGNGKFMGSMAMFTDITRRKEAETKLKETLDNLEEKVKKRTAELEKAYNSLKESERSLSEAQKNGSHWELGVGCCS